MFQISLRRKVMLGYALISTLALGLSLFTLVELGFMSQRLRSGEQVSMLLEEVLEMRRFEKNFFLYHQQQDQEHLLKYIGRVQQTLTQEEPFDAAARPALEKSRTWLEEYQQLVTNLHDGGITPSPPNREHPLREFHENQPEQEGRIRALGKSLLTTAETLSATERQQVRSALERHRQLLIQAMAVVAALIALLGGSLSHWIVLPLRQIEASMKGVAEGQFNQIHLPANDQEIISLTQAFNRVLHELQQRQKHLLRSEKLASLGTLLSGVAHELNNPLSNISTSCQILAEELEQPDPDLQRELVGQIDEQTRRARDIVRSLLDLARDRAFQRTSVMLTETIDEAIRFSKGSIPARIDVIRQVPGDILVWGDRRRLQQAFINLLKNALDAIPGEGRVLIRAERWKNDKNQTSDLVHVNCRQHRPWCAIAIEDTGTGMDETLLGRIFDPFFTTKPVGQGSGLGLAVVYEVIEEHEGCITVESRPGQGSCFRILLPLWTGGEKG
ncbi:MAG: HAMP domain-containing protein [Magnetococcales bacterium]|nr:HAMP domain-containing protein [Magnetococcales bacterium]